MFPVLRNNSGLAPVAAGPINRIDSLFDRVFGDDGAFLGQAWSGMPLAMWQDDDHFYVEVELPGVSDGDVEITVHNGMLSIRGERKPAEGRRYLYNARSYGRFERVITLPGAVQADDVQATLKDGILSLTLPKSPEAKPRKIALQAG
jgi:HSP20 family protein